MFSGANNPWTHTTPANRGFGGQRPQQQFNPLSQQAAQPQAPQGFQPPQVQWPQQTPDMGYAQQLAQMYASQMPNQQVPGSAPLPAMLGQPQQGLPTQQPQMPVPGQMQGDWRDQFKQAQQDWRMARPGQGMHGTPAWNQWRDARPDRGQFHGFGGQ